MRIVWFPLLGFVLFSGLESMAQELTVSPTGTASEAVNVLRACLVARDDQFGSSDLCIGLVDQPCQSANSNYNECIRIEAAAWGTIVAEEFRMTLVFSAEGDAFDTNSDPGFDSRAETLCASQSAWRAYVEADCTNAYAQWGEGSMRQTAGLQCALRKNAQRAVELRGRRAYSVDQFQAWAKASATSIRAAFPVSCAALDDIR